jgi:hypothetical protein
MIRELVKSMFFSAVRQGTVGLVTWLLTKGIITPDQSGLFVLVIAALLWAVISGLWNKYKVWQRIQTALGLEAGSSIDDLVKYEKLYKDGQ